MGGNTFYSNAEAYAFEVLQQKLMKEAQRSAQQTMMEFAALKALFNQGQFIYCIPFGGAGLSSHPFPFPFAPPLSTLCPPEPSYNPPEPHHLPLSNPCQPPPPPTTPPCPPATSGSAPPPMHTHQQPLANQQSVVHVNVKNSQPKTVCAKPGSDECSLGETGIEVTIDLREYLPAEINLDVEEKSVEIKACHVDAQGTKTFARRYDLPACIILDSVKCVLSHDGYLLFSAAWIKME